MTRSQLKRSSAIERIDNRNKGRERDAVRETAGKQVRARETNDYAADKLEPHRDLNGQEPVKRHEGRDEIRYAFRICPSRNPTSDIGLPPWHLAVISNAEDGQVPRRGVGVPVVNS